MHCTVIFLYVCVCSSVVATYVTGQHHHYHHQQQQHSASLIKKAVPSFRNSSHLRAYNRLMGPSVYPNFPKCDEAPHTVEHWLDCHGTLQPRLEIFGTTKQLPLSSLSTFPGKAHIVTRLVARVIINNSSSSSSTSIMHSLGYYSHLQASLENIPLYKVSVLTRHNCCGCIALL